MCSLSCVRLFCNPMDCSPPGSSVHGISQARILELGTPFPTPENLPDLGIEPEFLGSPALAGGFFTTTPPGKPKSQEPCALIQTLAFFYLWVPG